jgi:hypothetical protein
MDLARITHAIPLTTVIRERKLPFPGTVSVRLNERVRARDVVAESEQPKKHRLLDAARSLGIPEHEVHKSLVRDRGDRLDRGEIIAGPVGMARRTLRAPEDGRIVAINGGKILFAVRGDSLRLRAGFPGVVVGTDGTTMVRLETSAALLQGVWGNGIEDFGVMRLVGGSPDQPLTRDELDIELRGAVIVAGYCMEQSVLEQARALSARGLIIGGLNSELIPFAMELDFPIVVLEGFGRIPINRVAYELLLSADGREAAVDGKAMKPYSVIRPEVIIPLPAVNPVRPPEEVVPLAAGIQVRITHGQHRSKVGRVEEILSNAVSYPSGILARSVKVDTGDAGVLTIPIANLEILQ